MGFLAAAFAGMVALFAYPKLPSLDALTDYRPKQPLRVFTADGFQIGEFGEERRTFVPIKDVPAVMKNAILAAEDERFYQHGGVDTLGVLRAALANLVSGGKRQGASTITMQVARNFFLSSEKTLNRKVLEVLLSFKIEHNLSKDQILELYINQIYLGQRSYGFASAAQIYFGKSLKDLTPAEAAMLAGLPKAPSSYNPVANPRRARVRQLYVLRRMNDLGFLDARQYAEAEKESLHVKRDPNEFSVHADYVAEMARQIAIEQFHEDAYNRGLRVITTITRTDQEAAYAALRQGVLDYDRRHGYRGAEAYVDMSEIKSDQDEGLDEALQDVSDVGDLNPAVVLSADSKSLRVYRLGGEVITLSGEGLKFALPMLSDKAPANKRLRRGAIVRVRKEGRDGKPVWQIAQLPDVEAAFLSANPADGAIRALVGGFDFNRNKFNHASQAWRQPGSSFKPFIYSAALEKGYSPASVMEDAPITISSGETGSQAWTPHNYDGKYEGAMTLRTALTKSKNMVSIRLLRAIGAAYAQDYITHFGFDADKHPPYLTMALGAGSVTPWQQLTAYSVFANGGYRIQPYIVKRIEDAKGTLLAQAQPRLAGDESIRAIDPRNDYLMDSMMRDVVLRGTAAKAHVALKRNDLAGKTGTTNDYVDAWFCGYQPTLVGVAWIGFDQPRRLGNGETGGAAALPMWISYMEKALANVPEAMLPVPPGLIPIKPAGEGGSSGSEMIYQESLPPPPLDKPDSAYAPASEGE
ncbi:MAG: penicillin-binding protein 1A [Rhodocyclaceae bacterium]|nr:penicillin-binding protein 1A [Rhodocyclaceae bacterium]